MDRESHVTLINLHHELENQVRLLVDTYKKIYRESSNPKYSRFKDNTRFFQMLEFDGLEVRVELKTFYTYESEYFEYIFDFDKILMSKEELENFAKSEIEKYNSEKLAKEWGGCHEFDGSCFE